MQVLYITFGTNPKYPYGIEDYMVVIGTEHFDCFNAYKKKYPDPGFPSDLNCADYYTPEQWEKEAKKYYQDKEPVEILISDLAYGSKPEGFDPLWIFVPEEGQLIYMQEGTGDNLLQEDCDQGYTDYIDITAYALDNGMVEEVDGGMFMTKYLVREHYGCLADAIPDVLDFLFEDKFLQVKILCRVDDNDKFIV